MDSAEDERAASGNGAYSEEEIEMRFDVNQALLSHIATGAGAAHTLREEIRRFSTADLVETVSHFFGARSDIRRLQRAQDVARLVLRADDFADIMEVRQIVAEQEMGRLISYSRQKDHTAHTVFLYLLGIWMFDHLPALQEAVRKKSAKASDKEVCKWFLYHWLFASLLHDIGYAFYELSSVTVPHLKRIEAIYSWDWVDKYVGKQKSKESSRRDLGNPTMKELEAAHKKWREAYVPPSFADAASPLGILDRLKSAPWLGDLSEGWRGKNIFEILAMGNGLTLENYATQVATHGYAPGTPAVVDHAVASGLLLFQYVSYWFWLMKELDKPAYDDAAADYNYTLENVRTNVVWACQAAAYHNVQPKVPGAQTLLDCITLEAEPVLFLAIVCDELQRWDRYPAGDAVHREFETVAGGTVEASDVELICVGADDRRALLRIDHKEKVDIVADLKRTLGARARGFEKIVQIEEYRVPSSTGLPEPGPRGLT
jgi:hypothetical protein